MGLFFLTQLLLPVTKKLLKRGHTGNHCAVPASGGNFDLALPLRVAEFVLCKGRVHRNEITLDFRDGDEVGPQLPGGEYLDVGAMDSMLYGCKHHPFKGARRADKKGR